MGINKEEIKKILIIGVNWIGDTIITIPVVKTISENFPDAFTGLWVKENIAELWKNSPYINKIYSDKDIREIRKESFELGIILPQSFSSALKMYRANVKYRIGYPTELRGILLTHKVPLPEKFRKKNLLEEYLDILRFLGLKISGTSSDFFVPAEIKLKAEQFLRQNNISEEEMIIGVCPGATYGPAKRWFKERYAEVIKHLIKKYNAKVIIFGSFKETDILKYLLKEVHLNGIILPDRNLTVLESAGLINFCRLFITNDTGPMHIASSLKIPVIAIFGSTNPTWTAPLGNSCVVLYKKIACSPCYKRDCSKGDKKYECFELISVNEVINEADKLLTKKEGK